jgi:hypothetical protein
VRILSLLIGVAVVSQASVAFADQWVVRRQAESGQCSIQKSSNQPGSYIQLLSRRGNLQAACMDARARHQSGSVHMDVAETGPDGKDAVSSATAHMCSGYSGSARGQCHSSAQVDLP